MLFRPLILYLAWSIIIQQAISEFIDDFQSFSDFNSYGSSRVATNIRHIIDPPMVIMTCPSSSLTEGLVLPDEDRDLTGKAFRITYCVALKTMMKLKLIPLGNEALFDNKRQYAAGIEVDFVPNVDFVIVPMTHFAYTKSVRIGALQLTGPITHQLAIKSLELIDAPLDLSVTTYTRQLIDDFSLFSELLNSMNLGVHSKKCSLTPFGMVLQTVNSQFMEQLAPSNECMDLTSKSIRIMYSSHAAGPRKFVLQAKRTTCSDEEIVEYTALVQLRKGINLEIILPIAITFKNVNPAVCSRLHITGPVYLHRIELVDLDVGAPPIITASNFLYKVFVLQTTLIIKPHKNDPANKIHIRRSEIYDTAFSQIMALDPKRLRSKTVVVFENEHGVDQGGLSKELFTLLSAEIASPARKLFHVLENANNALQVDPKNNNLKEYRFVGRLFGMAILHNLMLNLHLVSTLYKLIQVVDITLNDMKLMDPTKHQSLQKMLMENIAIEDGKTMSVERRNSDNKLITVNLKPNGKNIPVTDANKVEYVNLYCKWRIETQFEKQVNAIRAGMLQIIPPDHLMRFKPSELSKLITGYARMDLKKWKMYTKYYGGYTEDHPVIQMFWTCVSGWTDDQRSKLLQFITGSPRFPEVRDSYESIFVVKMGSDVSRLPIARKSFNSLELPLYPDQNSLCSQLLLTVNEYDASIVNS